MEPVPNTPPAWPTEKLAFLERHFEYDGVYTYVFRPEHPVPFVAGQYGHVRVLSLPEDVRRVREFSFASSPQDSDIWFGIDSRSGSDYQKALQALQPGEVIELFKIKSHMTWPVPQADAVMIAGGIGVTPFRSMLRDRKQKNLPIKTTLVHSAHGAFLYGEELRELADSYVGITRPMIGDTIHQVAREYANAHYYVAGSVGFVEVVIEELKKYSIMSIESDAFKGLEDHD